jgi:starch synthase
MKLLVLMVSMQVRRINGTGGLGDVAAALPKALARRGDIGVRVVTLAPRALPEGCKLVDALDLAVPLGDQIVHVKVHVTHVPTTARDEPQVPCYLLQPPDDLVQKSPDSPEAAILLARASLELARLLPDFRPDVIQCNDWHPALVPVYRDVLYADDPYLSRVAVVFTTHNIGRGFQGSFPNPGHVAWLAGLAGQDLLRPGETRSVEHEGQFNFAKAALGFADAFNTVSITYSREMRLTAFAGGLDGVVRERARDSVGILNGIDIREWDPNRDEHLKGLYYSASDPPDRIIAQKRRIRPLLREYTLPDGRTQPFAAASDDRCLIVNVGRIDYQKVAILMPALSGLLAIEGAQFALLGEPHRDDAYGLQQADILEQMATESGDKLLFHRSFNLDLSHLLYAGADLFLAAPVFEPCGLTQLSAFRYGTIVVARKIGGLNDTVDKANGFPFKEPVLNPNEMADIAAAAQLLVETVRQAVGVWRDDRERWVNLMRKGMDRDSSWDVPAGHYVRLFHEALQRRPMFGGAAG